jgi:hypothetical protein
MDRRRLLTIIGIAAAIIVIVAVIVVNLASAPKDTKPKDPAGTGVVSDGKTVTGNTSSTDEATPTPTPTQVGAGYVSEDGSSDQPNAETQPDADAGQQGAAQTDQDTADQTAAFAAAQNFVRTWVGYDDTNPAAVAQRAAAIKTLEAPGAGLDATKSALTNAYSDTGPDAHKVTITSISGVSAGGQRNGHWIVTVMAAYSASAITGGTGNQINGYGRWNVELPAQSGGQQVVYGIDEGLPGYNYTD